MSTIPQEFPHLPDDISAVLGSYEDRLASGELKLDAKGDIIPDGREKPGWMWFVNGKLPDTAIHPKEVPECGS